MKPGSAGTAVKPPGRVDDDSRRNRRVLSGHVLSICWIGNVGGAERRKIDVDRISLERGFGSVNGHDQAAGAVREAAVSRLSAQIAIQE